MRHDIEVSFLLCILAFTNWQGVIMKIMSQLSTAFSLRQMHRYCEAFEIMNSPARFVNSVFLKRIGKGMDVEHVDLKIKFSINMIYCVSCFLSPVKRYILHPSMQ